MSCHSRAVRRRVYLALATLVVTVAAVAPYIGSVHDYFLADDFGLISLFSQKPTFHVLSILIAPWTEGIYGVSPDELRPTLALAYQFDSVWGSNNPVGYHLSNIAFHLICSVLVLFVAWRAAEIRLPAATLAAVLFAVLPIHPETVIWISGRADSIPAMFYLSAMLGYALWRRTGAPLAYAAAVLAFVLNLFSKQSAITLPVLLVAFDLLVERRQPRVRWQWIAPYVPFVGLTLGYLALRLVLFGNAVREQSLTSTTLIEFAIRQATYVKLLVLGSARVAADGVTPDLALAGRLAVWLLIALAVVVVLIEVWRVMRGESGLWRGRLLFFGPVWWLICILPLVVTYETARHLYLPSAGVSVAIGILVHLGWSRGGVRQLATVLAALTLIVGAQRLLDRATTPWRDAALISGRIASDLERELAAAPAGSVVVLGAPQFGASPEYHSWMWMWAMPFAAHAPFVSAGLGERVTFVMPPDVHCCPRDQWFADTRRAVDAWMARADRAPAIVLRWNGWTGELSRQTDREDPELRERIENIGASATPRDACDQLHRLMPEHVGSCAM